MLLLSCQGLRKAFGATTLFDGLSFGVFEGDRIGVVGPNGSGKSTLLKILAGSEAADGGTRSLRKNLRLAYVPQESRFAPDATIEAVINESVGEVHDEAERHAIVGMTLAKVGFPDTQQMASSLSGGWSKRLAIASALAQRPDLLLMDEPTNHLDVEGILWLERLLRLEALAYVVVSHDRYFLENVANRMIELNPMYADGFLDVRGSYHVLLERKDDVLQGQRRYQETLANRVRREVEWLKHGPKARTRKSSARIQEASQLQDELAAVAERTESRRLRLELNPSARKTKRLIVVESVVKNFPGAGSLGPMSFTLSPGACLGILGPNGSGKTTLLRMLMGEESLDGGMIERADDLRLVYLDQHREQIDPETTLRRTLAPHGDQIIYNERSMHVAAWARRFLFQPEQLDMPMQLFSGGERARVALARLLLRPADVLILDEPTNDLDIPTLEVLEESLLEFPGAIVLVTHDRFLFERVTSDVLAIDENGSVRCFADYAQWESAQRQRVASEKKAARAEGETERPPEKRVKRLTYNEKREWEQMEQAILDAEESLEKARLAAQDPKIAADAAVLQERYAVLVAAQERVDQLYSRWAELETKQQI